jgi:hypothetical protein
MFINRTGNGDRRVKQILTGLCLLISSGAAFAEMRIWQDMAGKRFKAEFVQELYGDIVLNSPDGHTRLIKLEELSAGDKTWLFDNAAPEIEIDFVKKTRKRPELDWTIPEDVTTLYTCTVKLRKVSGLPHTGKLTAELFLLAKEIDGENYVLVHREASEFVFPDERNSRHEFTAADVPFRRYYAGWAVTESRYRGDEYLGYLISVSDAQGRIVASQVGVSDAPWLTEDFPASVEGLRRLAINGRGSIYSRHFDTTFEKVDGPRIPWHKRSEWF